MFDKPAVFSSRWSAILHIFNVTRKVIKKYKYTYFDFIIYILINEKKNNHKI